MQHEGKRTIHRDDSTIIGDETMGGIYGVFTPTELYLDRIQKHV